MEYRQTCECQLNLNDLIQPLMLMLTPLGFQMADESAESITFRGPGMNSTKESPLTGASQIRVSTSEGWLTLEADLGGVRWMERFVTWFPQGLAVVLSLILGTVAVIQFNRKVALIAVSTAFLSVLPWRLLSPWICHRIRRRTSHALDSLFIALQRMSSVNDPAD